MAETKNTGLITELTAKALNGEAVTMGDVIKLAELVDGNTKKAVKKFNSLEQRINELEKRLAAKDAEEAAKAKTEVRSVVNPAVEMQQQIQNFLNMPTVVLISSH